MTDSDLFLRNYIRGILQETIVKIGDKEFDIPDDKLNSLKSYIQKNLGIKEYNLEEDYAFVLNSLRKIKKSKIANELDEKINNGYPIKMQNIVKSLISKIDAANLSRILFSKSPGSLVDVPHAILDLSDFKTPGSAGSQIGKGELAIPLLFQDASLALESNSAYDAKIMGKNWHVKEGLSRLGIRMGSAKEKLFSSIPIYSDLVKAGISPSNLNELGVVNFAKMLPVWSDMLQYKLTIEDLYDFISDQAIDASIGTAEGIIWYLNGSYEFTTKPDLSLKAVTQGRAILAVGARDKIINLAKESTVDQTIKVKSSKKKK